MVRRGVCLLLLALAACAQVSQATRVNPWVELVNTVRAVYAPDIYANITSTTSTAAQTIVVTVRPCCASPGATRPCISNCLRAGLKAKAIATLLSATVAARSTDFAIKSRVQVLQNGKVVTPDAPPADGQPAAMMLQQALLGNGYFRLVARRAVFPATTNSWLFRFAPRVAQYFTGDDAEWSGYTSLPVATAMATVYNTQAYPNIYPTSNTCNGRVCRTPITT